ncbi:MAG: hypothetical protein B6244_11220 [Candidatus Cloacimonetes bacterium 4572_55]|nr:MAG: hypothetical protein B6244_11220 [Candidatus Cloacimonetes bacterium 4572_55]
MKKFQIFVMIMLFGCPLFAQEFESREGSKFWIFFADKDISSTEKWDAAMDQAAQELSERALQRRLKNRVSPAISVRDLPVADHYISSIAATGATVCRQSRWLNAVSARMTPQQLQSISELLFVRKIEPVRSYSRSVFVSTDVRDLDYGNAFEQLEQLHIPDAHELGYSGADVLIAMLDTGYFLEHESFSSMINENRLLAQYDFISDDGNVENEAGDAPDQDDHGSVTLSLIAGYTEGVLIGGAYGASFLLAKTEDITSETPIEEDNWVAAIEWAEGLGVDVVNSSLGYSAWYDFPDMDGNTAVTTIAADIAAGLGVVVCTSMGNGYGVPMSAPADADSIISVSSVYLDGFPAEHNSVGPTYDSRIKPELSALGIDAFCADPDNSSGYRVASGTSMASPLIACCAALLIQAHPDWTAMQIREALMMTADNASNPDNITGWGIANVISAISYQINPITLVSFDIEQIDRKIHISWELSNDLDVTSYHIYRCDTDQCLYDPINEEPISPHITFFDDASALPGNEYFYQLEAIFRGGERELFPKQAITVRSAETFLSLDQNFPNPFTDQTEISFNLPESAPVSLSIYDINGRLTRGLAKNRSLPAGIHRLSWDGRNDQKKMVKNGLYFYMLHTSYGQSVKKMLLFQ